MKRLRLAIACCLPCAALANGFTVTIAPRQLHEECVKLEGGELRKYYWKSDRAVDFNIHYHVDKDVFYPVKRDGMRGDGGTFIAKTAQDYCWMWTARDKAVKVEGRIESK
ncbi:MAG TPA: hypothetical protein VM051_08935 [Usitatibacter sp.]|nr:hypothetical protein [Usitatibacter sp.]